MWSDVRTFVYIRNGKEQRTKVRKKLTYPIHIFTYITKERWSTERKLGRPKYKLIKVYTNQIIISYDKLRLEMQASKQFWPFTFHAKAYEVTAESHQRYATTNISQHKLETSKHVNIFNVSYNYATGWQSTVCMLLLAGETTALVYLVLNHSRLLLPYLLTYLFTPWCRVLLEKLTGFQIVNTFQAFYGTRSSLPHSQVPANFPYPE